MTPQERYLALLAAERDRRGEDARQRPLEELQAMAERMVALAPLHPLKIDDMSIAEMFACRWFLPEELIPVGLGTEDEIWGEYRARGSVTRPRGTLLKLTAGEPPKAAMLI